MKLVLPSSFFAAGKAGLASIFASLRNYVEIYHDHGESGGTPIPTASVPDGTFLEQHIQDRGLGSRELALTRVITVATGAFSFGGDTEDSGVTTNVNFSYTSVIMASYSAQGKIEDPGSGFGSANANIKFKVGSTLQDHYTKISGAPFVATTDVDQSFTHRDILLVPSGSQDIKVIWEGINTSLVPTVQPRRLELLVFKQ